MGVTGMAKSRQSNAVMTFMAHNDFARFARNLLGKEETRNKAS
jgi:hypothetical protein